MVANVFSIRNKIIVSAMAILFINCGIVFAADSTGTPSGTATQPDINQRGSNIIEVGTLETSSIDADSATVTGAMSAGTVSAPTGAITNLNTNRTYVQRTPTSPADAANKAYVDAMFNTLQAQINAAGGGSGSSCPDGYQNKYVKGMLTNSAEQWTGYVCIKEYRQSTNQSR